MTDMNARQMIINYVKEAVQSGARKELACSMFGLDIRTLQRWEKEPEREDSRKYNYFKVSNALTSKEREEVIEIACSPEYRDKSPNQIVPELAENGSYVASESTFYRLLRKAGLMKHRSKSRAPERKRPEEITACAPNQVWTWDITYLLTYCNGIYLYLYLILDIWDRSIVGWSIHREESGILAGELLEHTCIEQRVLRQELTVHQDNGGPMISSEFLSVLMNWGRPSYSRPGVSDDNPYSESHFRTLKYRPDFPGRFETLDSAIDWVSDYVEWYNKEHLHSKIGFVSPHKRRTGEDIAILEARRKTYENAHNIHPERWSRGIRKWDRPEIVKLNPRKGKKR